MSVFKFVSGGSLIVEASEDPNPLSKPYATTIDTWGPSVDSGRRRMPRDSGTYIRFRDSVSGNTTGWLTFAGNVDNWGYQVKDTGGFWNVHLQPYLTRNGVLVDPADQSATS